MSVQYPHVISCPCNHFSFRALPNTPIVSNAPKVYGLRSLPQTLFLRLQNENHFVLDEPITKASIGKFCIDALGINDHRANL